MREERRRSGSSQRRTTGNVSLPSQLDISGCIPRKIEAIPPCVDRLMQEITKSNCVAGEEEDVELAPLEAVGNAVIHGNLENPEKEVYIHCRSRKRGGLLIAVKDEGNGFDPREWENSPAADGDSEHGRGIVLMRVYMDRVHYSRSGSAVYLSKRGQSAKENREKT
jgi:anti-sigma regulatory factor (Ser/Thr protein kinase)